MKHEKHTKTPLVSVIVPCRNEREHIAVFLDSALAQHEPDGGFEVLIADGMSDDGTRDILERYAAADARVRIIDNPDRITPCALNRAIRAACGEIIACMGVHAQYARDYLAQCVRVMRETNADNVGGPTQALGNTYFQQAVALAFHAPFASGGAGWHTLDRAGEVDTLFPGCWRKTIFDRVGLFDEELVRNQDDEHNLRIVRAGGRIWQSPAIKCWYYPRTSLRALWRQYVQYGYWKVRVIQKHKVPASWRHLVPGAFVGGLLALAGLSLLSPLAFGLFVGVLSLYALANLGASLLTCRARAAWKYLPVMPAIFAAYHVGYGYGFLRGLLDFGLLGKQGGRRAFTRLTRDGRPTDADRQP